MPHWTCLCCRHHGTSEAMPEQCPRCFVNGSVIIDEPEVWAAVEQDLREKFGHIIARFGRRETARDTFKKRS